MTVANARKLLGITSNYRLALMLQCAESTVSRWGRMVPPKWRPKVLALAAAKK